MSRSLFLDTNGWIALLNATEELHEQADERWIELGLLGYRVVLTDWVIAETGNGLARSQAKTHFADALDQFWQSPVVDIVVVDQALIVRATDHYRRYSDKTWGLVDCASFIVMQDRGMTEAFTSDRDFQQAGFTCLLSV
ncbi:MAG: PIN domain-containing protein [Pirellulales bacterium]